MYSPNRREFMQYSGGATVSAFLGLPPFDAELAPLATGEIDKASPSIFLRLDDIPGDARTKGHEDEIACFSCRWGHEGDAPRGIGRAGDPQRGDVTVVKEIDKATPALYNTARRGGRMRTGDVTLERVSSDGGAETYCVLGLEDVGVASLETGQFGGESFERCVLDYGNLTIKYVDE